MSTPSLLWQPASFWKTCSLHVIVEPKKWRIMKNTSTWIPIANYPVTQQVTTTFKKNKGLFFVPAPPTGIGYANGCAYTIEEADNYRLRYETKVWEVAPMPNYPASIESVDCDDPSINTANLDQPCSRKQGFFYGVLDIFYLDPISLLSMNQQWHSLAH